MTGLKMLVRLAVGLLGVCSILTAGDTSAHPRANFKGTQYQRRQNQRPSSEYQALESAPASEVEYVDGPLAPLYGFLIQHRLQRFCKLLRDAGLEQVIQDLGESWTLFAPTDASFIFLPGGTLEELQRNPQQLRDFLLYHFVVGDFPSSQIQNELIVNSAQGSPLRFNIYGETMTVSGAEILQPDLQFELGRVYIVDRPLYPTPSEDIVTYLQRNNREMYRLLVDAGLIDYLSSGTFTLLAPDDQAFGYLSVELKDALATNISLAERILFNHILPGSVYIGGIRDGMQWETVVGDPITFTIKRGLTFANGIPIVLPDVPLTNGVIHVLNRVLLPEGIDADCQCKPSSDTNQASGQTAGRPPTGQTQRPPYTPGTARIPGQDISRQTPRPTGGQVQGRPQNPQTPPRQPVNRPWSQDQGRPQNPQTPTGQVNRPWSPSRTGQPVRPLPPANQVTQSPHVTQPTESLSDEDINNVVGPGVQPISGQKKPEPARSTRYPPQPPQRITPRPTPQRATTRKPQGGSYPGSENENYPEQEVTPIAHQTPRQTDQWSNRQRLTTPGYPTPQRGSYNTPTTRRPQTTRTYDWNQPRRTQPSFEQPDQEVGIDSISSNEEQGYQTQGPGIQTTNWQQRKQGSQTTRQPAQRTTFQTNRQPQPPQRRTTVRPPAGRPSNQPPNPSSQQPFNPNRQQPNCRRRGERITPFTQNLPLCSETNPNGCQNSPYDPTDSRPLCPESQNQACRNPTEPYDISDNRPLCPSPAPNDCRQPGQPMYNGDRRPLCTPSLTDQTGCKDPSAPFNPSDRRPVCSAPAVLPPTQDEGTPQGCKHPDETGNPQDSRPVCPEQPSQDCRNFLERPQPGDRRPICKNNRQQNQPKPNKDLDKKQNKPDKPQEQPGYPQTGQYPTQTTRRQSFQSTRSPQSWQSTTRSPQSWQSTTRAPQSWQSTTKSPQSWQTTTRTPQTWQSTTRASQSWQSTTRGSQTWQPTTRAPQSWQSTSRITQSWQTTRQPIGKQPQSGSGSFQTQPQTNPGETQSISNPQPGLNPSQPSSNRYPSQPQSGYDVPPQDNEQPQTGSHPSQPQPGTHPSQPQPGTHPSQPQSGRYPTQSQTNRYPSQPQSGRYPSQQQPGSTGTQPSNPSAPTSPQSGSYPSRVPPSSSSQPSRPQTGNYPSQQPGSPPSGSYPSQPQSGNYPSQQPGSPHSGSHTSQQPGSQQPGSYPSQPQPVDPSLTPDSGLHPSRQQPGSSRPFQPGQSQPGRPTQGYPQRGPGSRFTTTSPQQGISQPGSVIGRPNQQGHQTGTFATASPRRPVTTTTRVPISVTGTSIAPGEDSRRTLYEIVEDPALLIRGRPVKLTRIFELFHKAGLEDILTGPGPTTVFLPSDDAFALLPQGVIEQLEENPDLLRQVLLYHVTQSEILPSPQPESYTIPSIEGNQLVITMLNGGRLIFISGAKAVAVTRANNGIFYVINQLLYPLPHHDIVGAIQSRPDLTTLAFLLPLSGLEGMLTGQTPYTFLAPTDNAFAQLPQPVYDELINNATALQEILLNHIIEGAHYGREFFTGGTFPSARGGKLKFQVVSYGYQVNDVNIKTPEIVTGTGVIHLIDQVLLEDPDLQFFTAIENSLAGIDNTATNSPQPHGGHQQPGAGQQNPLNPRPVSPGNQPQIGGLQPSVGQPSPVGRIPTHGQRTPGTPQTSPGNTFGNQRQPSVGSIGQPAPAQPNPGQPIGSTSFGGRQPSTQGTRQPVQGQGQFQPHRQPTPQQGQGQPNPGSPSFGGQRTPTDSQRTQPGQRTPSTSTSGNQGHGSFQNGGQPNDVADLARSMGLNKFANWITNTGLLEKVHDGGVYTVFAPTDDAVDSLPQDMVYSIESNPEQVKPILQYHIIPQRLNLNSVTNEETASTLLQGKTIRFNVYPNSQPDCKQLVTASGTPVGESLGTMGSIQVIPVTQVLYQPAGNLQKIIEASPILQRLNEAVKSARLTWILAGNGPMTIFAPSDTAFESLTEEQRKSLVEDKQAFNDLLKRHIVRGTFFSTGIQEDLEKKTENNKPIKLSLQEGILTVNSVPVTYSDITATNGVLHVIDQFL